MEKKSRFSFPAVGASSLLVIFAVLCLIVFTLLALSTVQAGDRLSQTSAQAVSRYYEADAQAQRILAQLRNGELPDEVSWEGDVYSYACPISDTQELAVDVLVENGNCTILRWQMASTTQWEADETLDLWDGEFF